MEISTLVGLIMKSFKKFIDEDPSLLELLEYKLEQFERTKKNVEKNLNYYRTEKGDSDYSDWQIGMLTGNKEAIDSEIDSIKYQIKYLKEKDN